MKVLDGSVMDQDIWAGDDDFVVAAAKAIIITGNNQTQMAIYTVPNGKVAYMTCYYAHVNPGTNLDPGYAPQLKHVVGQTSAGFQHFFTPNLKFTEKTDIYITAQPVGKAADVSAGFDLIITDA
jgi:hypothetical protein